MRSLLLPLLLVGCASQSVGHAADAITPGRAFDMTPGQSVVLPSGDGLRYVGVSNDSRCPPGAQCIRAGDATVEFAFTPKGGTPMPITLNTATQPTVAPIGSWRLRLVSLSFGTPAVATVQVERGD